MQLAPREKPSPKQESKQCCYRCSGQTRQQPGHSDAGSIEHRETFQFSSIGTSHCVQVFRGFFFGNEPPDFPASLYVRRGDPRQIGVTFEMLFEE